jgi:hypothetical protein
MQRLLAVTLGAVGLLAGCAAGITPTVGTIATCGPGLDAAACRNIAQVAFGAYDGPALAADEISVTPWASCDLADVTSRSADAAANGTTCYSVSALAGTSGGRRVEEGAYQGGQPVNIDGLVWLDADGTLHAVTTTEPFGQ